MRIVQVELANGKERLTTWVDVRPNLREGVELTLKDFKPKERWTVLKLYRNEHDAVEFDWHRKWDNNI